VKLLFVSSFFTFILEISPNFYCLAVSADPLLVWNYGIVAMLAFFSGVAFWFSVRDLDRHEDKLNNLPEGHLVSER